MQSRQLDSVSNVAILSDTSGSCKAIPESQATSLSSSEQHVVKKVGCLLLFFYEETNSCLRGIFGIMIKMTISEKSEKANTTPPLEWLSLLQKE